MKKTGKVANKFDDKGFGFIRSDDGEEYFFHANALQGVKLEQVEKGAAVSFTAQASKRRPGKLDAVDVRLLVSPIGMATANPIRPGNASVPFVYPPYRFAPVNVSQAVTDSPVWHDGSTADDLFSGELLCTLEALTPLLPGNYRYTVGKADRRRVGQWGISGMPDDKQVAEPLRLADGRVVIAGSALKGMIRQSLGALLSAPMERVAERQYSYRPNLQVQENGRQKIVTRPAVIADNDDGSPKVWILDAARAAIFVRERAMNAIRAAAVDGRISEGTVIRGVDRERNNASDRIVSGVSWTTDCEYCVVEYCGGVDGVGRLGAKFVPPTKTYSLALIPGLMLDNAIELEIDDAVWNAYQVTQRVLSDVETGHLAAHPLLSKSDEVVIAKAIRENAPIEAWQLVYVEVTLDGGTLSNRSRVLSFGHNFRYRWSYTSSIRRKGGKVRDCLTPLDGERQDCPTALSGARLFFGYVHDENTPIGKGAYQRLAGRIAINHAVSTATPEFLGTAPGYAVPLHILGQPKPSAWEFYLRQRGDSILPATYGDLPGDSGGDLAGRKFYWHQPRIQSEVDLRGDTAANAQATLARFICRTGTRFRFALRFARLRQWELGALLGVLQPQRLAGRAGVFAHKLGLGRPLGMGSVALTVDRVRLRKETETRLVDSPAVADEAVAAFKSRLEGGQSKNALPAWLAIHRFADPGPVGYPVHNDPQQGLTIFGWHTDLRRDYSKKRRETAPDAKEMMAKIVGPRQ